MAGRELPHRDQGSAALNPAGTGLVEELSFTQRLLAAGGVGMAAFACYHATLLPGLDFGDTASFQTGVGSLNLTPRQAYPLYYGLGNIFALIVPGDAAHAMNFSSAVYGALAVAVASWVAVWLAGSVIAGVAAGLFLAFSYTFWTQSIIAEVYSLHLLLVGLCLTALLAWSRNPTLARLTVFLAVYALGFGNHLSMVLLLPAFALFILLNRQPGPDDPLRPKAIALAILIAAFGAVQYSWNFRGLWFADPPPSSLWDAVAKFWFDVTKADWRDTLVATVSEAGLQGRPAMYWFELRQQFGWPGMVLAVAGFTFIAARWRAAALLLLLCYLANLIFAWAYNVGDVHVFFLPSHYVVALCAGAGVGAIQEGTGLVGGSQRTRPTYVGRVFSDPARPAIGTIIAAACLLYPIWRGYDTFPAVDRSWDDRPTRLLEQFTATPEAVFGIDTNWQVQNAFEYYMRENKPDVPWFTFGDLPWLTGRDVPQRLQRFVDANLQLRRKVIVTPDFVKKLSVKEGLIPQPPERPLVDDLRGLRRGAPYALGSLRAYPEYPTDAAELAAAWTWLTGRPTRELPSANYTIVVGKIGQEPDLIETRDRPFRARASVDGADFDIRMESWLPTDTIRRAGFGHVIVNHRHVLSLDRGISFVALDALNRPVLVAYRHGIFAAIPHVLFGRQGRL